MSWERDDAEGRSEALRRDMVWALQAVHVPDLYYKVYERVEGLSSDEVEAGIFQPTTQEDFEEMLKEMGIGPDSEF